MQSPIDESTINMLKEVMEDDFATLIETYVGDAPQRLDELRSNIEAPEKLEKPAHTLKGSSANIGAHALAELCSVLVDQIRANQVVNPEKQLVAIEQEFARVKESLLSLL